MEKNIKVIIGANYGDEGKGLVTRYFAKEAENPIVIFHNGTAQRGHTVDYNPHFRHVYHHFNSGTADGAPTFFAKTFWLHPMEFRREWNELAAAGITPKCYCDFEAMVVTPFDMLIDHATEAYITWDHQEPEHGSCGYGTWCATDRYPIATYSITEYIDAIENNTIKILLEDVYATCISMLHMRAVDLDKIPEYKKFFEHSRVITTMDHFINDLKFFYNNVILTHFDTMYNKFSNIIFENGQGLGLDQTFGDNWHTTSNTGMTNIYQMLDGKQDFKANVYYVTRSYTTRHGIGNMENETAKHTINNDMIDKTNVPNEFQGSLRYGFPEDKNMERRITYDYLLAEKDSRFNKNLVVTHCNEFPNPFADAAYVSNNPYTLYRV